MSSRKRNLKSPSKSPLEDANLPSLIHLSLRTSVGVSDSRKRDRSDSASDNLNRLVDNSLYSKLVSEIIHQLMPLAPNRWLSLNDCTAREFTKAAIEREDAVRRTILNTVDDSTFFPQESSGLVLNTRMGTDTAEQIASLFFQGADAAAAETQVDDRIKVFMRVLTSQYGEVVWKRLAEDGVRALKKRYQHFSPADIVKFRVSVQRADAETYNGRASFVHMDGGIGEKLVETYGLPYKDNRSFVSSFCAQRINTNGTNATQISILDCGTIVYKGVPIVSAETISSVARKMSSEELFIECTDIDKVVSQIAANFNTATINALKNYTDSGLARLGITATTMSALTWANTNNHAFHRSPMYKDIHWLKPETQSDAWTAAVLQWMQRMVGRQDTKDSKMRFFCRMFVSSSSLISSRVQPDVKLYSFQVDGLNVEVETQLLNYR